MFIKLNRNKRCEVGYTFIELIIFIVILAVGMEILIALAFTLRHTHNINSQAMALQLAKQRMEIIYVNFIKDGYLGVHDPCVVVSPPSICGTSDIIGHTTNPSGFIISSSIVHGNFSFGTWVNGSTGVFKKITVNVSGKANASLNLLITNY